MAVGIHHLRLLRLKVLGGLTPAGELDHMVFYLSMAAANSKVPVPNTLAPESDVYGLVHAGRMGTHESWKALRC